MANLTISAKLDTKRLNPLLSIDDDKRVKLACHNTLKKMCEPYVPMKSGNLSQGAVVDEEGVHYGPGGASAYAHYQYMGEVYGPSFPIKQDGIIVGWWSPPGKGTKHPTGRQLNYSHEKHPLATSKWNQAMYRDRKDEFCKEIKEIVMNEGNWLRRNGR